MNQKERQKYRKELDEDKALEKEFNLHNQVDEVIKNELAIEDFKSRLSNIHDKVEAENNPKVRTLNSKWYWAAASAAVITTAGVFSYNNSQSPDQLYSKYYHTWNSGLITRGVISDHEMNTIVGLFDEGKYEESLVAINSLNDERQRDPKLILLKGSALMELDEIDQAIVEFSKFSTKEYTFYTDAANWYLALCYLKTEQTDLAKIQLNNIALAQGSYAEEAKSLLTKID